MSSSGQAPNVSMDDLLASIKSMIEGESSGEANSQVGANLESAPGMTPQGADAPNSALDDGIMDLTQVVSAPQQQAQPPQSQSQQHQPQQQGGLDPAAAPPNPVSNPAQDLGGINPLLQGQEQQGQPAEMNAGPLNAGQMGAQEQVADMSAGQSAQDAAAKLDDIFSGMDGDAGLNNMGGDIGLPASQMPDSSAALSQADPLNSNQMARGLGEAGETPAQAQMQNDLQAGAPQGNPLQDQASLADQLAGVTEGVASEGMDVSAGAEQPVVPLDQGEPQFNGALEGKSPPQSGVPHPGFAAEPETPGLDTPSMNPALMNAAQGQQAAGEQPQADLNPQMGGVQPLAGSNSGEPQRTELMGGHDPRLEHDIALGQALSQADASLNLSNVQGVDDTANQKMQQQSENNQANPQQMPQQAQMRGLPQAGQMPAHAQMGGQLGQAPVPQGMQAQQNQVQQGQMQQNQALQGQAGHQGHLVQQGNAPQGHMAPQAQMGQQPGQMVPQGYMGAPQQMGMPQMGGPQVGSPQGGADMLPVPSGFRPVLPAVHGQGDALIPGAMGDQLPVEMKNNLEEIVKQLLKPLLRDWLERNLPELLKGVVDEETGKIDPNKW